MRLNCPDPFYQGDPLSPMLFILVMDVLKRLFGKASEQGPLQPPDDQVLWAVDKPVQVPIFGADATLREIQAVLPC